MSAETEKEKITKVKHSHTFELGLNLAYFLVIAIIVAGIVFYKMVGGN